MNRSCWLAFSNAKAGREAEFEQWYRDVHVPDLLAIPGVRSAQRYALDDVSSNDGAPHRHLAVYEVDGDAEQIMTDLATRFAEGSIVVSDALDITSVAMTFWRPLGPKTISD